MCQAVGIVFGLSFRYCHRNQITASVRGGLNTLRRTAGNVNDHVQQPRQTTRTPENLATADKGLMETPGSDASEVSLAPGRETRAILELTAGAAIRKQRAGAPKSPSGSTWHVAEIHGRRPNRPGGGRVTQHLSGSSVRSTAPIGIVPRAFCMDDEHTCHLPSPSLSSIISSS